jgi:gamma-glutamyl-gamma-aminobutyrate hydrolase PuuD
MVKLSSFLTLAVLVLQTYQASNTNVVLVGVLAEPATKALNPLYFDPIQRMTNLPTSYTRFIEQSGAMSVIIPYDLP